MQRPPCRLDDAAELAGEDGLEQAGQPVAGRRRNFMEGQAHPFDVRPQAREPLGFVERVHLVGRDNLRAFGER